MMHSKDAGTLPLSGITVVDITQVIAGPFATMNLGDLGADVIKIEAVGRGDRSRGIEPVPEYFDTLNRNKHSLAVDLKSEDGQQVIRDIVRDTDVFIESMKPGRADAFNVSYEDLKAVNPGLVYCSISGFGRDSPYENLPAWDMLIQGMSGIMSITGEEDGPPLWSGLPSGDLITAMYTTQSVLAALYARERDIIRSEWIEVPMFDAAISWLSARAGYTFGTGEPFPHLGTRHPSMAPFGVFDCQDEKIVIAAGTDSLWQDLCSVLGQEELADDERFATLEDRVENVAELSEVIETTLQDESAETWSTRLQAENVPAGPIRDTRSVWSDAHVKRRTLHRTMKRDCREDADVIDHPVHYSELVTELRSPPEHVGESTTEVLSAHGYTESEIERLRASGIVE